MLTTSQELDREVSSFHLGQVREPDPIILKQPFFVFFRAPNWSDQYFSSQNPIKSAGNRTDSAEIRFKHPKREINSA